MRAVLVVAVLTAVTALSAVPGPAAATLDSWEPAQLVPRSDDGRIAAFFSTLRGRVVTVYKVPGSVYVSSRAGGSASTWGPARDLQVPNRTPIGPVAAGDDGGATVFHGYTYSRMRTDGAWGPHRSFPYYPAMEPKAALVTDDSGLVVAGIDDWKVEVAVRSPGELWRLSPKLAVGDNTVLRGLWTGADGRTHVLVTQEPHPDDRVRVPRASAVNLPIGLYEAVLRTRQGNLTWGPLREWGTGSAGDLYEESPNMVTRVLAAADGAITAIWHEYDETNFRVLMFVRHRDPGGTWSPARTVAVDGLTWMVPSLDEEGQTRLSYLRRRPGAEDIELVTRLYSSNGVLGDPILVDGPLPINGFRLDGAVSPDGGATLLKWYADTGTDPVEERLYRCLPEGGCTGVGEQRP